MKRFVGFVCTLIVAVGCASPGTPARGGASRVSETDVDVTRVVDGDTIVVALGDARGNRVRLIGIDTPERDACIYRAASERMRALVGGKRVRLVKDVSETDRYGRLLRYVYVADVFVNAAMVREGFAAAATFPPDVAHADEFATLERAARQRKLGLWSGSCAA